MKKKILALAAGSAMAVAAPAFAQSTSMDMRINDLQAELQAGVQSGSISRSEAQNLREHMRSLRQTERTYSMDGLSRTERQYLNDRIRNLRQQINYAERTGDSYDRYGQSNWQGGFVDRNRDGYDDRDMDRDGRWDDDTRNSRDGMGGPYDEVSRACSASRGISGILGSLLGSDNCINVGERVGNWNSLGTLPYQYRGQFPDQGGYYHRYLNGRIVQVDGRTGTVVRIYDVD